MPINQDAIDHVRDLIAVGADILPIKTVRAIPQEQRHKLLGDYHVARTPKGQKPREAFIVLNK